MNETVENPRAVAGDNMPPPIEDHRMNVEDLLDNARQFLDGAPVETQAQADAVGKLLDMLREAGKAADAQRKNEAKPFDDGKAAVQELWKPLMSKIDTATAVAKKVLGAFLIAEQARKDAQTADARRLADEAADRARKMIEDANAGNDLAARERAEEVIAEAAMLAKAAKPTRAQVAGGMARAVSLRTRWTAALVDPVAAARHYWLARRSEYEAMLVEFQSRCSRGTARHTGLCG